MFMLTKLTRREEGGWENYDICRQGGDLQMLTLTKGGRGSGPHPFFADIINEQSLIMTQTASIGLSIKLKQIIALNQ